MKNTLVKYMGSKRQHLFGLLAVVGALLASGQEAMGQADWPTFHGSSSRTGKNADPNLSGPGRSRLIWFTPNASTNIGGTVLRNNTARQPDSVLLTGNWFSPDLNGEASFPFDAPVTLDRDTDERTGANIDYPAAPPQFPNPFIGTRPPYHFSRSIASDFLPADPTQKKNAADVLSTFTWIMDPQDPTPRNYALYVWLPTGSTFFGPLRLFPQRFFVYEIIWGPGGNQRTIDVVDTYAAGPGWVRLGNRGFDTNRMFPYNGVNPIQIRLYNTVPRDVNGQLTELDPLFPPNQEVMRGDICVYADAAMAVPQLGTYHASPVISQLLSGRTQTVAALNEFSVSNSLTAPSTGVKAVVTGYTHNTGTPVWSYSPTDDSTLNVTLDNRSAGVTAFPGIGGPPGWSAETFSGRFQGIDYFSSAIQNVSQAGANTITYGPTLEDGLYEVQLFVGGDNAGEQFAQALAVEVHEGASVTTWLIDQSQGPRWIRVGNRRFNHNATGGDPLRVVITNFSSNLTDVGKKAYADAARFIGTNNLAVTSTPIQQNALVRLTPGGIPVLRSVVIVAAEDGRIYCLDAEGNGIGGTTVYWTYPSLPDASNPSWTDPNHVAGEDGPGGVAIPPTGFDLSSGFIERIGGEDVLFIAASNGRVYAIDVAGRGDLDATNGRPGTTTRRWTYPNDYPAVAQPSSLGQFRASISFATTAQGPTVFVPAAQGRLYALDATGNANKTTDVRWTFPPLNQPTLGPITTTPAVEFDKVYFGTFPKDESSDGQFFSLDMNTGAVVWQLSDPASPFDAFMGGPATASALLVGGLTPENTIFITNDNRFTYGVNADTGAILWRTNELNSGATAPLAFTPMTVFDNFGVMTTVPVVIVPTEDGRFSALFAREDGANSVNRFGTKRAAEYVAASQLIAGVAIGRGWMYGADSSGNLYAFNDDPSNGGPISPGTPPGFEGVTENNPAGDIFRLAKIKLLNKNGYQRLRLPNSDPAALSYDDVVLDPTGAYTLNKPLAFEWGETMYLLVYDFPYATQTPNGSTVTPPIVNFQISTDGAVTRQFGIESRQFKPPFPTLPPPPKDGYAILAFPIQGSGPNSLPPGTGRVNISITSGALNNNGTPQQITLDPSLANRDFTIANPLSLVMRITGIGVDPTRQIGFTTNPADPGAVMEGSRDIPATPSIESQLGTSVGLVSHSGNGSSNFWAVDRSLITLLRGPGRGLDNVRIMRRDLEWMGGATTVEKQLPGFMTNFEDLPVNFPNTSIDYPNILAEMISVTKDPNGAAENPIYSGVSLTPPSNVDENNPLTRTLLLTPMTVRVDVPRYQPPTIPLTQPDSGGEPMPAGYTNRMVVFVDSNSNGVRDGLGGRREAARNFVLSMGVQKDESLLVRTPIVDLQSLPGGAGYNPLAPGTATPANNFSPWATIGMPFTPSSPDYVDMFKSLRVENDGNVNLNDLRLAHWSQFGGGPIAAWPIYGVSNDDFAWLDASKYMWSDIDPLFALTPRIVLQKARVGDRYNTVLKTNPERRENAFLGVLQSRLLALPPSDDPRVAVTPPIGFPEGTYQQVMRVIEDSNQDLVFNLDANGNPIESFSDPTFLLRFKVREDRGSNNFSQRTAAMFDDPTVIGSGGAFAHQNLQPAAMRTPNGDLIVGFASDRPAQTATQPTAARTANEWKIYFSSLDGSAPGTASAGNQSPLRDLGFFTPYTNSQWFRPSASSTNGYPSTNPNTLFGSQGGENIVAGTARYGAPSFPAMGFLNPYAPTTAFSTVEMVFLGEAQKQTPGGRINESRIMVGEVTVSAAGEVTVGTPDVMPYDPNVTKSKPSIVKTTTDRSVIMYSSSGTGQSQLFYTVYDDANPIEPGSNFSRPQAIPLGDAFESASSPSATARLYEGADAATVGSTRVIEYSFAGKLRGRTVTEIFFGRMPTDASGRPTGHSFLPVRFDEILVGDREPGTFRTLGVGWNRRFNFNAALTQTLNGVTTNLLVPNSATVDRTTGLMTYDTVLGGKVYLDPNAGTIRFASASPNRNAVLMLDYQPRFLRVSQGQASGYVGSSMLFDNRIVADLGYWARNDNSGAQASDTPRSARFLVSYNRAAAGAGQAARPFYRTLRLGVQLPSSVYAAPNGVLTLDGTPGGVKTLTVAGAAGMYQVDPANGRVYFEPQDEDRTVTISYRPLTSNGTPGAQINISARVTLVAERTEGPVPIEQAVNESNLAPAMDPFGFDPSQSRRPNIVWMFWTSTRAGVPDIYFQTISPKYTPVPAGN